MTPIRENKKAMNSRIENIAFNTLFLSSNIFRTPYGATHLTHNLTRMPFMRKILTPPTTLKGSIAASVDNTTNTANFTRRHQDGKFKFLFQCLVSLTFVRTLLKGVDH